MMLNIKAIEWIGSILGLVGAALLATNSPDLRIWICRLHPFQYLLDLLRVPNPRPWPVYHASRLHVHQFGRYCALAILIGQFVL